MEARALLLAASMLGLPLAELKERDAVVGATYGRGL
jgi:hypothetical protein